MAELVCDGKENSDWFPYLFIYLFIYFFNHLLTKSMRAL